MSFSISVRRSHRGFLTHPKAEVGIDFPFSILHLSLETSTVGAAILTHAEEKLKDYFAFYTLVFVKAAGLRCDTDMLSEVRDREIRIN